MRAPLDEALFDFLGKYFIDNEILLMYYFIMNDILWRSRWSSDQIRVILVEQFEAFWRQDTGIPREKLVDIEQAASGPHAVIISGLRRVGKSTLLAQMAHRLGKDAFYYINFEDDRFLDFKADDATDLFKALVETFGERNTFIIDEIQNIPEWERFVRRFMMDGMKFYITGSNASLLSRELGTRLTGRYIPIELFPFSFREFLQFQGQSIKPPEQMTTVDQALLNASLRSYLQTGGIPEALKYPELPILRTLFNDVLYRDIATRHRIEAVDALKKLAFFLSSNPASLVTFNKLKAQFQLGSVNTIASYIDFMENSWLLFAINLYDFSLKRQQLAPKKIYSIDTGLTQEVGFHFSPNTGKLLENLVFLALRRHSKDIYYLTTPSGFEVDFYLPESGQLLQVSQRFDSTDTREREIRALIEANKAIKVASLLILSDSNLEFTVDGLPIKVQSIAEWLLSQ